MKLLKEKYLHRGVYCYSRYDGYFEHTRENGEVMLLHITMNTKYNSEDIEVDLFTKDRGFKCIANFWTIDELTPIQNWTEKDKFIELVNINLNVIEEWLDIVFH